MGQVQGAQRGRLLLSAALAGRQRAFVCCATKGNRVLLPGGGGKQEKGWAGQSLAAHRLIAAATIKGGHNEARPLGAASWVTPLPAICCGPGLVTAGISGRAVKGWGRDPGAALV